LWGFGAGPQNYTKNSKGIFGSMKTLTGNIVKFMSLHGLFLFVFFSSTSLTTLIAYQSRVHQNQLKQKDAEIFALRSKINNHLIAEGFYEKPAKYVLPIMKSFGIDL
jgi:hypothetical protein